MFCVVSLNGLGFWGRRYSAEENAANISKYRRDKTEEYRAAIHVAMFLSTSVVKQGSNLISTHI